MTLYELHYQKPGDEPRVKRSTSGTTARFTLEEGRLFIERCGELYPNAKLVPLSTERPQVKVRKRSRRRVR